MCGCSGENAACKGQDTTQGRQLPRQHGRNTHQKQGIDAGHLVLRLSEAAAGRVARHRSNFNNKNEENRKKHANDRKKATNKKTKVNKGCLSPKGLLMTDMSTYEWLSDQVSHCFSCVYLSALSSEVCYRFQCVLCGIARSEHRKPRCRTDTLGYVLSAISPSL